MSPIEPYEMPLLYPAMGMRYGTIISGFCNGVVHDTIVLMNEGEKPFIGDEELRRFQKEEEGRKADYEKWKATYEEQLADLERFLVFEKEGVTWLENEISDKEKAGEDAAQEKARLAKDKESVAKTEKMIEDWKAWISESTLDTIRAQNDIDAMAELQDRFKKLIIDKKPGQEN